MGVTSDIKTFYRFVWVHNNERNKCVEKCSKNSSATLLLKSLKSTCNVEAVVHKCSSKLGVLKNLASFTGKHLC